MSLYDELFNEKGDFKMKFYNRTPETLEQLKAKLTIIYNDSIEFLNRKEKLDIAQAKYLCGVFEVLYLSDLIFDDEEYEHISNRIADKYKEYYM